MWESWWAEGVKTNELDKQTITELLCWMGDCMAIIIIVV